MDRETIDNLHENIEQWYTDYLVDKAEMQDEENEWYLQLKAVLDVAYGSGEG